MKKQFNLLIKELRVEKGMTINKLAEKSGFSSVQIRNIEKGLNKPQVKNLKNLSDALGCDYGTLFDALTEK